MVNIKPNMIMEINSRTSVINVKLLRSKKKNRLLARLLLPPLRASVSILPSAWAKRAYFVSS